MNEFPDTVERPTARGRGTAVCEKRQSQVGQQMDGLCKEIERMKDQTSRLENRLSSVLRKGPPLVEAKPAKPLDLTLFAQEVKERAIVVGNIADQIKDITERLEL